MQNYYVTIGLNVEARGAEHAEELGDQVAEYAGGALYDNGADAHVERVQRGDEVSSVLVIQGEALVRLLADVRNDLVYKISIDERGEGIAYKVNEGLWTPTLSRKEI